MSWYSRHLKQVATYWHPTSDIDDFANRVFMAPVQVACRWEDFVEIIKNSEGKEVISKAKVFVDIDMKQEGYLYLGESTEANPLEVSGAYEIVKFDKTPGIRNEYERIARL